jgi:hypothetical protein
MNRLDQRSCVLMLTLLIATRFSAPIGWSKEAAPDTAGAFARQYSSDQLSINLNPDGRDGFNGRILFKGQSFSLHASVTGNALEGMFDSDGNSFPFTASMNDGALIFTTGGTTYRLQPVAAGAGQLSMVDFTVHDNDPNLQCDAVHLRVPKGWWAQGQISWGLTALSPSRALLQTGSTDGPEMWVAYPVQTFVWRDNFNLFGLQFPLKLGDADPVTGEEIERPLASPLDCITRVILPRFRRDLTNATVVSSREYSPEEVLKLKESLMHGQHEEAQAPRVTTVRKAGVIRFEYAKGNRTLQEDVLCLTLYADMPTNNLGVMHLWQIEYASSFRAEKGRLDDETRTIADAIRGSIRPEPQWLSKASEVQKQVVNAFGQRLTALAQSREADIRRQANNAIFEITQRSYHRRMEMEGKQFHQMDNAISGLDDYKTPDGRTIQAPIAPAGQSAWLGSDGKTYNFNSGVNPNEQRGQGQSFEFLAPE